MQTSDLADRAVACTEAAADLVGMPPLLNTSPKFQLLSPAANEGEHVCLTTDINKNLVLLTTHENANVLPILLSSGTGNQDQPVELLEHPD